MISFHHVGPWYWSKSNNILYTKSNLSLKKVQVKGYFLGSHGIKGDLKTITHESFQIPKF